MCTRQPIRGLAILVSALALAGAACGGDPVPAGPTLARVSIRTFDFQPSPLVVRPGTTVTWRNHDDIVHTVTSGIAREQGVPGVSEDVPAMPDGLFDEQLDGAGSTASFTFSEPGTYDYFCDVHAGMAARVVIR